VTATAAGVAVLLSVPRAAFLRAVAPHVAERRAAAAGFLRQMCSAFRGRPAEASPLAAAHLGRVPRFKRVCCGGFGRACRPHNLPKAFSMCACPERPPHAYMSCRAKR